MSAACATVGGMDVNGWDLPRAKRRLHAAVCEAIYGGLERGDVERIAAEAVAETERSPIYIAQRERACEAA